MPTLCRTLKFFSLLLAVFLLSAGPVRPIRGQVDRLREQFKNPPAGYGEVPFWWWTGEKLDGDRLVSQLDELHQAGISGVQINYAHRDAAPWLTYPPDPEIFSDAWWAVYDRLAAACAERGMGIGVSGYTLDWQKTPGNLFSRIVYDNPETLSRNIVVEKKISLRAKEAFSENISDSRERKTVAAVFYPMGSEEAPLYAKGTELLHAPVKGFTVVNGKLIGTAPSAGQLWLYAAEAVPDTLNPLHPDSGRRVIEKFFQPFEDHSPTRSALGLNYFFQDELQIGTGPLLWIDDLPEEFQKRKGYSLFEALPVFFSDRNGTAARQQAVKYRLDWFDVRVRLAEERYFKPIFDWHNDRGLIYACDPSSRGYNPSEFCDYFSAIRWYTAPGHDTPGGNADFIKNRVSSSIAHFYHRPRVWLEGYHSLGWGATPERIFRATCENFIYGANLLNLHGLYYSTYGSWWEWAPPCYHFRMPYWRDFGVLLRYFERLSFLMSRGRQKADILIYYPVSEFQGADRHGEEAAQYAFETARHLSAAHYNIFFVDDDSIARGRVEGDKLVIDGEAYSALILPNISAIRWNTLTRLAEWREGGGSVVALNIIPSGSDRAGRNDAEMNRLVKKIFADPQTVLKEDLSELRAPLVSLLEKKVPRDVIPESPDDRFIFQHRVTDDCDVFVVMGAKRGVPLTFRAVGRAELWSPWTGEAKEILRLSHPAPGLTRIIMPENEETAQVIVFDRKTPARFESVRTNLDSIDEIAPPGEPGGKWRAVGRSPVAGKRTIEVVSDGGKYILTGQAPPLPDPKEFGDLWESEIIPTLDNRYGDFRLPVEERFLGPEARRFEWTEKDGSIPLSGAERVTYGFGPKFLRLGPFPDNLAEEDLAELDARLAAPGGIDPLEPVAAAGKSYNWTLYPFSWREGIDGNPGHEGYHGLKELLDDRFIGLGKNEEGLNETLFVPAQEGNINYLLTWVHAAVDPNGPIRIATEGEFPALACLAGEPLEAETRLRPTPEKHPLLLRYDRAGRYALVLVDESAPERTQPPTPLAMKWFEMPGRLDYDVHPGAAPEGVYTFLSPPGLTGAVISAKGPIAVYADGRPFEAAEIEEGDFFAPNGLDGSRRYRVRFDDGVRTARRIEIHGAAEGACGGAFFPEPIRLETGTGEIALGSWNEKGVLDAFSGGILYRQKFTLTEDEAAEDLSLDLGDLCASARVLINGVEAGTLVTPPWRLDISGRVRAGENVLEVEVRNTLSNHYLTIPTRYRGDSPSGLFGPVRIEFRPKTRLESR
ncbi:MAG: hypothetical protein K6E55_00990 [Thermoguttaceae bacterium]|nr:hypothetical protein [Thermoguttaceae bacterium]